MPWGVTCTLLLAWAGVRRAPAHPQGWDGAHQRGCTATLDTNRGAAAPGHQGSDHKLCFVFQSSLTTATLAERITQVCCCHCNPKRHNPNSGSAPQLPLPHPGGAGMAAMPRNNPPPLADGLPLPRGFTSGASSCAPEFTSRGAGGRQSHRGAFPHCPDRNRIIPFPELPECERGECLLCVPAAHGLCPLL